MNNGYNFILASASPRRKELLSTYIKDFKIMPADIEETVPANIEKEAVPLYIAQQKVAAVKPQMNENDIIITADTIVLLDDIIYGKPKDKNDAFNMINNLSGKEHKVITGVCCFSGDGKINIEFTDTTLVTFTKLEKNTIESYLTKNEYTDKAGAYAVQGYAALFVEKINGSYDNVVGLPIGRLMRELLKCNINIFQI